MFPSVSQRKEKIIEEKKKKPKQNLWFWVMLVFVVLLGIFAANEWQKNKKNQKVVLEKKRQKKFEKDSVRLENCVQYALLAAEDGFFTCYSCLDSVQIFLRHGEVWYYGETCYEKSRYSEQTLKAKNLLMLVQYRGNKQQVILEQKRKIYAYPTLPEALKRKIDLIRPPGNKTDN